MESTLQKKLTILLDSEVYQGLYDTFGARRIGASLNTILRPLVCQDTLEEAYAQMARDQSRESEMSEWDVVGEDIPLW